jgi:hypothetical protein
VFFTTPYSLCLVLNVSRAVLYNSFFFSNVGTYILVITSRKELGTYLGSTIYGVASMRCLNCNEALKELTTQEV